MITIPDGYRVGSFLNEALKDHLTDTVRINLNCSLPCPRLYARKLWETLFCLEVQDHQFDSLDAFLCDLTTFEKLFIINTKTFWWSIDRPSGWTVVGLEKWIMNDPIRIETSIGPGVDDRYIMVIKEPKT